MIKYTKTAIDLTIKDLKLYYRIFKILCTLFMMGYFIYAIITQMGNLVINIIFLSLLVIYTVLDLLIDEKKVRKVIRHGYTWIKLSLKAVSLGMALYGVYEASENVKPINIIILTLMIILWIVQFILEIVVSIFESKRDFILTAIEKDIEETKDIYRKPVNKVKNFFKGAFGYKVEEEEEREDSSAIKRIKKFLDNKKK